MKTLLVSCLFLFSSTNIIAQIKFGLGVGPSWNLDQTIQQAYINKTSDTIFTEESNNIRYTISANIIFHPLNFEIDNSLPKSVDKEKKNKRRTRINDIGVVANLKLLEISNQSVNAISHNNVHGGMGLSYKLNSNLFLSFTYDIIQTTKLKSIYNSLSLDEAKVTLTELELDDSTYFTSTTGGGISIHIIYVFGKNDKQ